jgi:hypothetical protein
MRRVPRLMKEAVCFTGDRNSTHELLVWAEIAVLIAVDGLREDFARRLAVRSRQVKTKRRVQRY